MEISESKNAVAATWLISFHQIQRFASRRVSIVHVVYRSSGYLPVTSSTGLFTGQATKRTGSSRGLSGQADDQTVSLHRLVHLATRNWLRNKGILEQWTVNTAKRLRDIIPSNEHENRILWREYLPHALFILRSKKFQNKYKGQRRTGLDGCAMP